MNEAGPVALDDPLYWRDLPDGGDLRRRSVRGASITAVAQVPKLLLTLVAQLALTRLLDPTDFGLVAMVTPVIGFVQVIADLGLTQAVVSRPRLKRAELNAFFWINLLLSVGLALVAVACAPLLAWMYREPRVLGVAVACGAIIVVGGAGMLQSAMLNREMRYGTLVGIETGALLLSVAVGVACALLGLRFWSLVIGQASLSLTTTVLSWAFSPWRPERPVLSRDALGLLRFGGNITVSNIAGYLNTTLDNVMIGAVLGSERLGLYDRAWKLGVLPLTQALAPFNRVAVPTLSRVLDNEERYRNGFAQIAQATFLIVMPAMIFGAMLSAPLIGFVLGERWLPAAPIFAWLCVGATITPVNSATFWALVSQGRAREQMIYGTAAATINVIAYAAGLHWGIVGVTAASALSVYLLQTPMLVWAVCRSGPVGGRAMTALLVPNAVAGTVTALILHGSLRFLPGGGIVLLAAAATLSFATFGGVLLCIGPSRRRLFALLALIRRREVQT